MEPPPERNIKLPPRRIQLRRRSKKSEAKESSETRPSVKFRDDVPPGDVQVDVPQDVSSQHGEGDDEFIDARDNLQDDEEVGSEPSVASNGNDSLDVLIQQEYANLEARQRKARSARKQNRDKRQKTSPTTSTPKPTEWVNAQLPSPERTSSKRSASKVAPSPNRRVHSKSDRECSDEDADSQTSPINPRKLGGVMAAGRSPEGDGNVYSFTDNVNIKMEAAYASGKLEGIEPSLDKDSTGLSNPTSSKSSKTSKSSKEVTQ